MRGAAACDVRDGAWHRWFAWYPVTVGTEWVWLEWVERRCVEWNYAGETWECR